MLGRHGQRDAGRIGVVVLVGGRTIKLWLDDVRDPKDWVPDPDNWTWAKTYYEAIDFLKTGVVIEASLDHDLADLYTCQWCKESKDNPVGMCGNCARFPSYSVEKTGYDVVCWIENQVVLNGFKPPILHVHSANVGGAARMEQGIKSINYLYERLKEAS